MKLGRHFQLEEFLQSATARKLGISMAPPRDAAVNLQALVLHVLDPLRDLLKRPITVTSGYRPPYLNARIGGARSSQHVLGQAADIQVRGVHPRDVAGAIVAARLPFDQLILEFNSWVHVSYSSRHRREVLTTTRDDRGKVVYQGGLR